MQTQTFSQPSPPVPAMGPMRALLLDDSQFDRARIRRLSDQANLNIQIDEVDNLTDMQSAVEDAQYDLFLIDYRLPVGDGFKAMQMIRADPRNDSAGNILITGQPQLNTTVRAMRNGYHDVLSKDDMTAGHLSAAIHTAVSQARRPVHDDRTLTRDDVRQCVLDAMGSPAMHAYLGQVMSEHWAAVQGVDSPDLDPVLDGLMADDEFVFVTQIAK